MEERHDEEAAVGVRELVRGGDVGDGGDEVAVRERDALGARCGAGRVQEEGDGVRGRDKGRFRDVVVGCGGVGLRFGVD